ncbi:MAG: type III-B CRISPR module RAMP protein Cmr1 [Pseudothermotoga sp.]|uniref:type III-B CRISPR module RAMP protein Cmr1 n=1 Tax=Pseudothermotoga sp. TaxID=2033661 RepID=UPI000749F5F5|nr:MAG: CRISPR-associated RAMP protein, Cmr1 family [Desulfonauticus sp. 38_4375]MBC7115939.1 type III-B CRISPR module RAMP protein Cmr1 [Pseudothermotoga sp.]
MKLRIKTLTPIWTGDVERKSTNLRETGIIGSLRWWFESLVRGFGGNACDPASDNRCPDEDGRHCAVCELFGCTGWAKKFRLEIESSNLAYIPEIKLRTREKRNAKYLTRNVAGFMGEIILKFIPLRKICSNKWALLNKTLDVIANYGGLGARTSQGNGVIKITENNLPYTDKNPCEFELLNRGKKADTPNLANFFFYKFHLEFSKTLSELIEENVFWTHQKDDLTFSDDFQKWKEVWERYHFLPIAFHVRDSIRRLEGDKSKRHNIFGDSKKGSRIFVSHGYRYNEKTVEVRIWGYDVEESIKNKIKKKLEERLKEHLFSEKKYSNLLENCKLIEERSGKDILSGDENGV